MAESACHDTLPHAHSTAVTVSSCISTRCDGNVEIGSNDGCEFSCACGLDADVGGGYPFSCWALCDSPCDDLAGLCPFGNPPGSAFWGLIGAEQAKSTDNGTRTEALHASLGTAGARFGAHFGASFEALLGTTSSRCGKWTCFAHLASGARIWTLAVTGEGRGICELILLSPMAVRSKVVASVTSKFSPSRPPSKVHASTGSPFWTKQISTVTRGSLIISKRSMALKFVPS
mmetsp:Transcript_20520/g.56973  ORF Transcript_20520/g.56973 Transcript_20520/m.56973 type:complete len:231 (+) Transcript_20520:48-740(+)